MIEDLFNSTIAGVLQEDRGTSSVPAEKHGLEIELPDDFYFLPNHGNLGDMVIAEAEYQLLDRYRPFDSSVVPGGQRFNLVYGGGGLFVKYWNYEKILDVFKAENLAKCVILPSSFYECDDLLRLLDERFTVYCRERRSYEYCIASNNRAKFILADDMAFNLDFQRLNDFDGEKFRANAAALTAQQRSFIYFEIYLTYKKVHADIAAVLKNKTWLSGGGLRLGYILRTDKERQGEAGVDADEAFDLSRHVWCSCADPAVVNLYARLFVRAIDALDIVVTDRLHVGIVAARLGKQVYLLDNSYGKLSGVYEQSMKTMKNVSMIKPVDFRAVKDALAWEETPSFTDFLKVYLSRADLESKVGDTILRIS
ncbi:MAG: polysaccharide pyruvyl transferase family protein [Verrucomicrobiales bacterium]|nr:polysaccharide pyruvyl transferase family protein [Verrucomicrobiales bacterium]